MSEPFLCQLCGWYHLFHSTQEIVLELSLSEQARKPVRARMSRRKTEVSVSVYPLQQLSRLSSYAGKFEGEAGEDECIASTGHGCAWSTDHCTILLGVDRHLMPPHTAGWETRPTGMESQHTGSFPRCAARDLQIPAPRGHLRDLGYPLAWPGGWDSFPSQWQVPYPLAWLFSSPGRCSPPPCCAPSALSQLSRSRPAGWGVHADLCFREVPPRSRLPLPSHARRRCCGPGSHGWLSQQPPLGGTRRGGGQGSPRAPRLLAGGGSQERPGPQLPRPRRRPPCPGRGVPGAARRSPSGGGAGGGLCGRYPRCPMAARAWT